MKTKSIKLFLGILISSQAVFGFIASAQYYDYTSSPFVDYGASYTSYPTVDYGTSYTSSPVVDYSTSYTSSPFVDYGASYTSSPVVDYGTSYTSYPTVDYGTSYTSSPVVDYSTSYTSSPVVDYGTSYTSTPVVDYGTSYTSSPTVDYSTNSYSSYTSSPVVDYGASYTSYPTVDYGTSYTSPIYTSVNYDTSLSYGSTNYGYPTTYGSSFSTTPIIYGTSGYNYSSGYSYPTTISIGNYGYSGSTYGHNTSCPAGSTLVNGVCQISTTACPSGSTLVNGVCQVTSTTCPSGSTLVNGTCQINNSVCPSGSTLVNGVCQAPITCPAGTVLTNGSCLGNGTIVCPTGSTLTNGVCQISITSCPSGSTLINGICTINNIQNTYTCSNGSIVSYSFQCPFIIPAPTYTNPTYTYPTYNYPAPTYSNPTYTYPNYTYPTTYSYGGSNYSTPPMNYQVCWDGTTIPGSSICPSQYKTCANGSYVSVNQSCYVASTPSYVAPPVVKFNNVVTSIVTEITNTSGRCNGIGLIANGVASTGWFEYGETANLGRTTASASIGNTLTAPFSNVLANLKPTTKYYCRAVMQNQYGVVKGEIVSFITKAKATIYVKPVTITKATTTKKVTASTEKTNKLVCVDGSYISVTSESSVALLNKGEKLVMLQVEKTEGKLIADAHVSYKVMYKNLSSTRLTGVLVKVTLPSEIQYTTSNAGVYEETTHTLTINQDSLDGSSEGSVTITGTIIKDAPIGKTIVTTAYALYTVPGTKAQDEVTAYVVGSILPADNISNLDTGAKKVVGNSNDRGFMPNNLVEWLALTAIIFIIFILGRSIYLSYKEGEGEVSHH